MAKKLIDSCCKFVVIQIIMVAVFLSVLKESKPIELQQTKQTDITVEEVYYYRNISEYRLTVCANSEKYVFTSRGNIQDYSVSKLSDIISVGDKLSIIYYEKDGVFADNNVIVDARTKTKTYRSFEKYNEGKQGLPLFISLAFAFCEIVVCGAFIFYIVIWKN